MNDCEQDREQIQESFCAGKIKVVVATVAFGMGVDAQGVRGVVHMTLPRSLEEYVQQVTHTPPHALHCLSKGGHCFPRCICCGTCHLYACGQTLDVW